LLIEPYYQGFKGKIYPCDATYKKYIFKGCYETIGPDKIRISELPVGTWTQDYKEFLEGLLDENKWLGETYTLEVSSPGVSRPLVLPRQFKKHLGRKLVLTLEDNSQVTGIMKEVDEEGVLIVWEEKILEGKKKINTQFEKRCSFNTIKNALVKVSF
jgi:hypothetical protein